uniref:ABC-2 type transporter n=1 Tax=Solibacter usitatus (strain Ellin6076) TaxID=234267 RepID=Q028R6_SOLUE
MSYLAFQALVRRDLRLFFMDRRAVVMSFVAPIVIGSFFGYIFGGVNSNNQPSKISVAAIDQDGSTISKSIVADLAADKALDVTNRGLDEARAAVKSGKLSVAAVIPKGFGENAARSFFRSQEKPEVQLLYDPSHGAELQMVRGMLMQHVMETVSREALSGSGSQNYLAEANREVESASGMNPADRQSLRTLLAGIDGWNRRRQSGAATATQGGVFNMPYTVREEAITARAGVPYNSMAHSFAGMCVQFILFMGIDAGMTVLMQRRTGLWKRLQAAPISRWTIIGSRAASAAIVAMIIMLAVFGFARVVFGVRIDGSFPGFLGVCVAFAIMTATFGLLVAVLGKTPEASRGIAILVTLLLVMLGGSWVPAFIFPQWLQNISFAVPTRWAVDGLDGLIWRGWSFHEALAPIGALLAFAALFGAVAVWRFRWEVEG